MIEQQDLAVTSEELNRLYWNSARTVDEIVRETGVGRNTLYTSIQPLEAGVACARCGSSLVYTNRTHRAAGTAVCLHCGYAPSLEPELAGAGASAPLGVGRDGAGEDAGWRPGQLQGTVTLERVARIGGAAALGAMVGAAAARAMRD